MAENAVSGPERGLSTANFFGSYVAAFMGSYVAASTLLVVSYAPVFLASRQFSASHLTGLDNMAADICNPYAGLSTSLAVFHATGTMVARHISDIAIIVEETHEAMRDSYTVAIAKAYKNMLEVSRAAADITAAFADNGNVVDFPRKPLREIPKRVYDPDAHTRDNVKRLRAAFER